MAQGVRLALVSARPRASLPGSAASPTAQAALSRRRARLCSAAGNDRTLGCEVVQLPALGNSFWQFFKRSNYMTRQIPSRVLIPEK